MDPVSVCRERKRERERETERERRRGRPAIHPHPPPSFSFFAFTRTPSTHLYGDVYTTPGLPLATKQLLMVAFLGEAVMPDQLFGHALAGLREGATASGLLAALDAGFQASRLPPSPGRTAAYEVGLAALEHAWARARAEWEEEGEGEEEGAVGQAEAAAAWEGRAAPDLSAWGL